MKAEEWIPYIHNINKQINKEFGKLRTDQLNWKPSSESWSIAQCLEHLFATSKAYFPIINDIANKTKKTTIWENMPLIPSVAGRALIDFMSNQTRKYKTTKDFYPSRSEIHERIVEQFLEQQKLLSAEIERIDTEDYNRIVTSPIMSLITYSISDCITIILLHQQRHIDQAKRVMLEEKFPI